MNILTRFKKPTQKIKLLFSTISLSISLNIFLPCFAEALTDAALDEMGEEEFLTTLQTRGEEVDQRYILSQDTISEIRSSGGGGTSAQQEIPALVRFKPLSTLKSKWQGDSGSKFFPIRVCDSTKAYLLLPSEKAVYPTLIDATTQAITVDGTVYDQNAYRTDFGVKINEGSFKRQFDEIFEPVHMEEIRRKDFLEKAAEGCNLLQKFLDENNLKKIGEDGSGRDGDSPLLKIQSGNIV